MNIIENSHYFYIDYRRGINSLKLQKKNIKAKCVEEKNLTLKSV